MAVNAEEYKGEEINETQDLSEEELAEASIEENAIEEAIEEEADEQVSEEPAGSKSGDKTEKKEGKSFFKKKEKKDKKDEKIEELTDKYIRLIAEFDNYRKRTEKEKSQMFEIGAKDIIETILPVIDNFERGLAAVTDAEKESAFVQGIEKIYKQLLTSLESVGVKPIEAVGKEFDPNFHNAVMHAEDEEFGENIVAEEFQKGYLYHESVVRHSMVKVVN